jgi:predicted MFS family arabinose efflux permease
MGVIAVVGRLAWGHTARRADDLRGRLLSVALIAVVAVLLFWSASLVHRDLLWAGAFAWGVSILSVGALGNLAVLVYSVAGDTGRASGVMLTGFGIGLMIGPPLFGWTVDTTGAYDLGFGLLTAELLALGLISVLWGRRPLGSVASAEPGPGSTSA